MKPFFLICRLLAVSALLAMASPSWAREVPLGDFFKDPDFSNVSLSPTGEYITVSKPEGDRTVLAAFRVADMKLIGKWDQGARRHIDRVTWVTDERFLMFVSTKLGRYDFRVGSADMIASNVDGTNRINIPNGNTYSIVSTMTDDPRFILVQRSVDSAYLFRMDVNNGRVTTVASAPLRFGSFMVDHDNNVRYVRGSDESNNSITLRRDGESWTEVHRAQMGGAVRTPIRFAEDNTHVYFSVSKDGEPSAVVLVNPETGEEREVSRNANVDPGGFLVSGDRRNLLAINYEDGIPGYQFIDTTHADARAFAGLVNAFPDHAVAIRGTSRDGSKVLLHVFSDVDPGSYYLFDRSDNSAKFLLAAMDWIKPAEMSEMRPISLTARDGTPLHGYLTVPRNSDGKNLPLILHPHGGPHGPRDSWRFNPEVQFLANRGYAVLQINFRGSGGYGNRFERLGYRNWGTTMIDDMADAVDHVVRTGVADPNRVCTYGASYGGYAALQSVVRYPDKYQCTVGYVGVYSLPLMFRDGDIPRTPSGRSYLQRVMPESQAEQQAQSAVFNVDRINVPVMLVQGGRDERVPPSQYRALRDALANAGKPVEEDILEPREGHGFYDFDNQVRLYTRMQQFFDRHIGNK